MNPNAPFQPNAATRAGWPGRSSLRITNYAPRPVKVRVSPSRSDLSNPKPPPWPARRRSKPQRVPHPIQPELQSGPCIRKDLLRARRGRARHSVRAAPATNGYKFPPTSPSQPVADHGFSQMLSSLFPFLRFETAPHNHPTHRRRPPGGRARHSVRAALGIQPPELSTVVAIQTRAAHLKLETFKKQIMQVPAFTTCYARSQSTQDARPRRHWLPSPLNGERD